MRHSTPAILLEPLEERSLFSVPSSLQIKPSTASKAPQAPAQRAVAQPLVRHRTARSANFVVAFYGLGGGGFGNEWLRATADAVGQQTGSVVRKYQETQGSRALVDLFRSLDTNSDRVISTGELATVHIRVLGFSFGAVQGADFTRSLTQTRRPILGYRLAAAVPVDVLVTIDPVNVTPLKHTDGPVSNVRSFVNYYEFNPNEATMRLTDRAGRPAGTITFSDVINPVGGPLPSSARRTRQTLVDYGAWASRSVTHYLNRRYYGTMNGADVNHVTMPWYLYSDVLSAMA